MPWESEEETVQARFFFESHKENLFFPMYSNVSAESPVWIHSALGPEGRSLGKRYHVSH